MANLNGCIDDIVAVSAGMDMLRTLLRCHKKALHLDHNRCTNIQSSPDRITQMEEKINMMQAAQCFAPVEKKPMRCMIWIVSTPIKHHRDQSIKSTTTMM
jgi:hypothetical protein